MQLSSQARKALAAGLAASTILMGAAGLVPQLASAAVHSDGCVVLSGGVVWLITNGTRRGFTSAEVFASSGYNFSQVVTASAEDVALPVGPIMTYADGTLVKGPNDPLVYLVAGGQKRPFVSGSVFTGLGYSFANIQQAPVNTFQDLPTGSNLDSTAVAHPAGTLVNANGTLWWMSASGRMGFPSMAVFNSYGLMLSHAVTANSYDLALPDQGAVALRAGCTGGNNPPPVSGSISASLASDNPGVSTLISGGSTAQGTADLAHFAFSGSGTINTLVFERIGVSDNATLGNVYLYNGSTRVTDSASVGSDNKVTFAGLNISVPTTLAVKADLAVSKSGQTVGIRLVSINGSAVSVSGNIHNIANATLATVSLGAASGGGATDPGSAINVWQSTVTVGTRDVVLNRMALRQIGSISSSDIRNFVLQVDGVTVASSASLDSNGYVTFAPNSTMKSGTRTVKVLADIVGGSGRTYGMSLRGAYDFNTTDTQYNVGVTTTTSSSFPLGPSAATINGGTLSVVKASDSPSANLVVGANDQSLAKYTFTSYGEAVKVETLRIGMLGTGTVTNATLRNVRVMVNGSQVGSTTDVPFANSFAADSGTSFTTNFYVYPGTPVTVEVRGDMVDSNTTSGDDISDGTVTAVQVALVQTTGNGVPQTSLTPIAVPSANKNANSLTVSSGTMTIAQTTNYGTQTVVVPATAYKIGSYQLIGNATETVNVNTIYVGFTAGSTVTEQTDLSDLYIVYGGTTSPIKGTVSSTVLNGNTFSVNFTLGVNESKQVDVYATLASSVSTNAIITTLAATGVTSQSGTTLYADSNTSNATLDAGVTGQTINGATSGTISAALGASNPASALVDDSGTVTSAAFKFTAATDSYTVTDLTLAITNTTAVSSVALKDGSTTLVSHSPASLTFNNLNITVPANSNKTITVELTMSPIGVGAGTSGQSLKTTLSAYTFQSSGGTKTTYLETLTCGTDTDCTVVDDGTDVVGNDIFAFKAIPTITNVALPTSTLTTGINTLAKFTISSGGSGTISWDKLLFTIAKTSTAGHVAIDGTPKLYDADSGAEILGTPTIATLADTNASGTIKFIPNSEQEVSGAKTYVLKANVTSTGGLATGDNVNTRILSSSTTIGDGAAVGSANDAATLNGSGADFIWSDESKASHSTSTFDWFSDYLVKNLPTDSQVLSK